MYILIIKAKRYNLTFGLRLNKVSLRWSYWFLRINGTSPQVKYIAFQIKGSLQLEPLSQAGHMAERPEKIRKNENIKIKGEPRPEISLLHIKVLTLIKAKSNVFLWYMQCCSCTRRSKTKILTTRAPPSWIEFDVVTSQRQTQSASDCVMQLESITWDSQTIFLAFTKDQ